MNAQLITMIKYSVDVFDEAFTYFAIEIGFYFTCRSPAPRERANGRTDGAREGRRWSIANSRDTRLIRALVLSLVDLPARKGDGECGERSARRHSATTPSRPDSHNSGDRTAFNDSSNLSHKRH